MKKLVPLLLLLIYTQCFGQTLLPPKFLTHTVQQPAFIPARAAGAGIVAKAASSGNNQILFFPTVNYSAFKSEPPQFLEINNITYNDSLSNISLYSEIASDYLGAVRVSIGTTITYPKSDNVAAQQEKLNKEKFMQRFATGGGTLILNFALPIVSYDGKLLQFATSLTPKFSLDPPSFGVTNGSFAHNTSLGTDIQIGLSGAKKIFYIYGSNRFAFTSGNSAFYDALQLSNGSRKGFWLNTYTIGLNVKDVFTISYQKFWGSKNIAEKLTGYLTFTISPNFK